MPPSIEKRLTASLRQQAEQYKAALDVASSVLQQLASREDHAEGLEKLNALMADVRRYSSEQAPLEQEWKSLGKPAPPELQRAFNDYQSRLQQLLDVIQQAETAAVEARDGLRPQLDAGVQSRKVMQSYRESTQL